MKAEVLAAVDALVAALKAAVQKLVADLIGWTAIAPDPEITDDPYADVL